tara:strand:+ start:6875 stop:7189 length:315 start_codon:yes stop_codon:yes gene_type:complete
MSKKTINTQNDSYRKQLFTESIKESIVDTTSTRIDAVYDLCDQLPLGDDWTTVGYDMCYGSQIYSSLYGDGDNQFKLSQLVGSENSSALFGDRKVVVMLFETPW